MRQRKGGFPLTSRPSSFSVMDGEVVGQDDTRTLADSFGALIKGSGAQAAIC